MSKDQFPAPINDGVPAERTGVATLIGGLRDESRFSLVEVVSVVFRHWKKAAAFTVLLFSVVYFYTFYLIKDTYTSEAQIFIRSARPNLSVDPANPRGVSGEFMPTFRERARNESEIILSRALAETVVDALGPMNVINTVPEGAVSAASTDGGQQLTPADAEALRTRAVRAVLGGIETTTNQANVIKISYTASDPESAHRVLDTLTKKYVERHKKIYESPASPEFFAVELDRLNEDISEREDELRAIAGQTDVGDIEAEKQALATQQRDLREQLGALRAQKDASEARIRSYESAIASREREVEVSRSTVVNEEARELDRKLLDLELEEKDLAVKYLDDHRELVRIRDQIALIRSRLDKLPKNDEEVTTVLDETRERLNQTLIEEKATLDATIASEVALTAEMKDVSARLRELAEIEPAAARLQRQIAQLQESQKELQNSQQRAFISSALDRKETSNVIVSQEATKPFGPDDAQRRRNILFGAFTAVMAGVILAFVVEYLDDSMKTSTDVERRLELPVLATIAYEKPL